MRTISTDGHALDDLLGQLDLGFGRRSVGGAAGRGGLDTAATTSASA